MSAASSWTAERRSIRQVYRAERLHDTTLINPCCLLWALYETFSDPSYTVCKRVLGTEGDIVEVEPRRSNITWSADSDTVRPLEGRFVRIPKGHVWLAGDNLSNSTDSRTYGPVPIAMVRGKVIARVSGSVRSALCSTRLATRNLLPFLFLKSTH